MSVSERQSHNIRPPRVIDDLYMLLDQLTTKTSPRLTRPSTIRSPIRSISVINIRIHSRRRISHLCSRTVRTTIRRHEFKSNIGRRSTLLKPRRRHISLPCITHSSPPIHQQPTINRATNRPSNASRGSNRHSRTTTARNRHNRDGRYHRSGSRPTKRPNRVQRRLPSDSPRSRRTRNAPCPHSQFARPNSPFRRHKSRTSSQSSHNRQHRRRVQNRHPQTRQSTSHRRSQRHHSLHYSDNDRRSSFRRNSGPANHNSQRRRASKMDGPQIRRRRRRSARLRRINHDPAPTRRPNGRHRANRHHNPRRAKLRASHNRRNSRRRHATSRPQSTQGARPTTRPIGRRRRRDTIHPQRHYRITRPKITRILLNQQQRSLIRPRQRTQRRPSQVNITNSLPRSPPDPNHKALHRLSKKTPLSPGPNQLPPRPQHKSTRLHNRPIPRAHLSTTPPKRPRNNFHNPDSSPHLNQPPQSNLTLVATNHQCRGGNRLAIIPLPRIKIISQHHVRPNRRCPNSRTSHYNAYPPSPRRRHRSNA